METNHFSLWHDKAGNAVAQPLAGVTDPHTGVKFPDLNATAQSSTRPTCFCRGRGEFRHRGLPDCSIVRPTLDVNGGALGTIKSFTADRLFEGQSPRFVTTLHQWAREADAAQRQVR